MNGVDFQSTMNQGKSFRADIRDVEHFQQRGRYIGDRFLIFLNVSGFEVFDYLVRDRFADTGQSTQPVLFLQCFNIFA